MNFGKFRKRRKLAVFCGTEASQIVELAITLPLLLVVAVGLTDFSGAFNLKFRLSNAAREGARFAANQSTADLSNTTPASIVAIRDVVDNYLTALKINDCGLSSVVSPAQSVLTWTYTASTGCPGTLTLTINRGDTFAVAGGTPAVVEATDVKISYPYQWRFSNVIQLLVPGATYAGLTQITEDAVVQNLN
ncbi:MAG: TadE/TadG family type IV pilus assembly protein [Terriglobales bacterium]